MHIAILQRLIHYLFNGLFKVTDDNSQEYTFKRIRWWSREKLRQWHERVHAKTWTAINRDHEQVRC